MNVTVNKETMLTRLKENRDKHHQQYELALEGYKIECRKELGNKLNDLGSGNDIDRYISAVPPEDHTKDYDDVIDMLTMAVGSEIDLSQAQFKQYARDDWGWKDNWVASNAGYVTTASSLR